MLKCKKFNLQIFSTIQGVLYNVLNSTLLNLLLKNIVKSESTRDKAGLNGGSYILFGVREENIANGNFPPPSPNRVFHGKPHFFNKA